LIKKLFKKENYFEEIFENFDLIYLSTFCNFILKRNNKKIFVDMIVMNVLNTNFVSFLSFISSESSGFCMTERLHEISYELLSFINNLLSRTFIFIVRN